jgi:PAS domain S-box-containing protein
MDHEKFRQITENMTDVVWTADLHMKTTYVSPSVERLLGESPEAHMKRTLEEKMPPESLKIIQAVLAEELEREKNPAVDKHRSRVVELQLYRADGSLILISANISFLRDESGAIAGLQGVTRDISDRKQTEAELRAGREYLKAVLDSIHDAVIVHDLDTGAIIDVNQRMGEMYGVSREEAMSLTIGDISQGEPPYSQADAVKWLNRSREQGPQTLEWMARHRDGHLFPVEVSIRFALIGGANRFVVAVRDISGRKQVEEALRKSEANYRLLVENQTDMVVKVDLEGRFLFASPSYCTTFGKTQEELLGQAFMPLVHEKDRESTAKAMESLYHPPYSAYIEQRAMTKAGWAWLAWVDTAVLDSQGKVMEIIGVGRDITERKQAEETHEKLQAQLIQARKMESIGRLAGGVAHDFNNMLSVIKGYAELAMAKIDPSEPLYDDLTEIVNAARRSTEVTRQLLAFARKQTVAPRVLDLNKTVEGMLKMLRRLIGEDMDLAWLPGQGLWPVKMDPSQIDQILANLCINARDAIAGVGRITLETRRATLDAAYCEIHPGFVPGDFVLLAVSDNGSGMDPATLENLFEPFFTTKAQGQGTGLGLATIYGMVKQNNGFINVYSEPGKGATFKIYLPRHTDDILSPRKKNALALPRGQGETVLLVEDEPSILKLSKTMLEKLGYSVLAAGTPGEALDLARNHPQPIDLLITDVVMPEMNGRDLAECVMTLHPSAKLLFMSGYTANVIAHHGVLDEGVCFIEKPFSLEDLAVKVLEALENEGV